MCPSRWLFLPSVLFLSSASYGQSVEESDSEAIESTSQPAMQSGSSPSEVARLIVEKTNAFRIAQNKRTVEVNPKLTEAAQYFASYMAKHDRYGHTADGNRPSQRATKFGYDYCIVSENIAYQFSSAGFTTKQLASRFFEGWKHSPGHRKNMLDADVVETGVAVARSDETGYWYAVQMFGRPDSAAIEFSIANRADAKIEYTIGEQTFLLPPRYTQTHWRCRKPKLTIDLAADQPGVKEVQPTNGDRFTIVQNNGLLELGHGE